MADSGEAPVRAPRHHDPMTTTATTAAGALQRANARFYDLFLALSERRGMRQRRRALLAGASGRVLEIGAGTGLNLDHYPSAVDELVLTEPEPGMRWRLEQRAAAAGRRVSVVEAGAEDLPFPDASFDAVVSTMVLCTVPDPIAAMAEIRRVLRPAGRLLFIEHVRADDEPRLARWQDRLEAPWRAFGEGCRCNQPTLELLDRAGLQPQRLGRDRWRGMPPIVAPLVIGEAA
jgi:ubiquinone/menaquinone biosynthesis C-methylase UbiE